MLASTFTRAGLGALTLACACSGPMDRDDTLTLTSAGIHTWPGTTEQDPPATASSGAETGAPPDPTTSGPHSSSQTDAMVGGATTEGPGETTTGTSTGTTQPDLPGSDAGSDTGSDTGEEPPCVGVAVGATPKLAPVDIIVVVDNSGSMLHENAEVQSNLEVFTDALAASTIDYRLFLISQYPDGEQIGICVGPDLGNGGCPTSDSQGSFLHIDHEVASNSALHDILDTSGIWYPKTRLGARKHFLVVSDDDAAYNEGQAQATADAFHDAILAEFPGFFGQYAFHAIVGIPDAECIQIARAGYTYQILTGSIFGARLPGVLADLCQQDFTGIFTAISDSIADGAQLPCDLDLPAPAMNQTLNLDEVNVHLQLDDSTTLDLVRVANAFSCPDAPQGLGWYYHPTVDPTAIRLCGAACTAGQVQGAELELELGCESLVPL